MSLIVVPTESNAAELRSRIQSGASFEALAITYSTDPTAARAGYLGMMDAAGLSEELKGALEGLPPGAVSPVTRRGNSFAFLKWATAAEDHWRSQHDDAQAVLQQGRYAEAASLFLAAIRQAEMIGLHDVRLAESLNGLAQVYRYQSKDAEAEPLARRALEILERAVGPSHRTLLPSLVNLAAVTRATGRYPEAEQLYRRILSARWGPGADQVLEKFAEVLTLAHTRDPQLETALEDYFGSLSESRLDQDLYVGMRDRLMTLQLMTEAESLMQHAVRRQPDSRQLRYRLGELYVTWGKYQKAIEAFEEASRRGMHPDPAMERIQLGRIYERIGEMNLFLVRFDEAFAALKKALELNPASTGPRVLLAALYVRRNKLDEAATEYRRVIATAPGIADAHDGLAQVDLALGDYRESIQEADKALQIEPQLQSSRYTKGMALIRAGRDEEGRKVLQEYEQGRSDQQTEESRRDKIAEIDRAASAMLSERRSQEAIALLRDGIHARPLAAVLHLKLGLVQSRSGLHREAADTFETMVRLNLDDFLVHRQLSLEYEFLGKSEASQQQRVLYLQRYDAVFLPN